MHGGADKRGKEGSINNAYHKFRMKVGRGHLKALWTLFLHLVTV